jgi:hypothetical protein
MTTPPVRCQTCGSDAGPGNSFCEICGQPLGAPAVVATSAPATVPPTPGDVAAVLRFRGPSEPATQALAILSRLTTLAGFVAVAMILIGLLLARSGINLFALWLLAGAFVVWRSFISIPSDIRRLQYQEARHKLVAPAIVNILFLGILPGILLLVAYFRSRAVVDAPPLHLDRG